MPGEDLTLKLGLLMEAAEAQQTCAANALERLREHTGGLDAIVREEIRSTLSEELAALRTESCAASQALRRMKQVATLRAALWSAGLAALSAAIPVALASRLLPTRAEVAQLRLEREELREGIARLTASGAAAQLRRCGSARRLCVRVERNAAHYGAGADYFVVKGY